MKKTFSIIIGMVIGGLLVTLTSSTMAYVSQNGGSGFNGFHTIGMQEYRINMQREVKNIENGVEVTMTTTDPTTLEHMKEVFAQTSTRTSLNSEIKVDRVLIKNGMKMTLTSTNPDTVKSIQSQATSADYGMFGGIGRGTMMGEGYSQGFGQRGNGYGRGGCGGGMYGY